MGGPRVCGTPGAIWGTEITARRITLTIDFPLPVLSDLSDASSRKTSVINERRDHLHRMLHRALLPVIEGVYQERWGQFVGQQLDRWSEPLPATWADLFK